MEIVERHLKSLMKKLDLYCPPYYGLRDYGGGNPNWTRKTPDEFIEQLVSVFREVRNILTDDGTLWVNLETVIITIGQEKVNHIQNNLYLKQNRICQIYATKR